YQGDRLPFDFIEFVEGGKVVRFQAAGGNWQCDLANYQVSPSEKVPKAAADEPAPAQHSDADEDRWGHDAPADDELSPEEIQQKGKKKKFQPGQAITTEAKSPDG